MERRLYRSQKDKIIGGVAGGLGEYFEIDPVIIRIIFVVLTVAGGWGVVGYVLCWVIIPLNPAHQVWAPPPAPGYSPVTPAGEASGSLADAAAPKRTRNVGGIILVLLGVLLLGHNLLPRFDLWEYWPIVLIVSGVWLLARAKPQPV